MKTCKTCKWWHKSIIQMTHEESVTVELDVCANPSVHNPLSGIEAIATTAFKYPIITGPDFGCIHHEENKPDAVLFEFQRQTIKYSTPQPLPKHTFQILSEKQKPVRPPRKK